MTATAAAPVSTDDGRSEWIEERTCLMVEGEGLPEAAARALAESCWRHAYGAHVQPGLF